MHHFNTAADRRRIGLSSVSPSNGSRQHNNAPERRRFSSPSSVSGDNTNQAKESALPDANPPFSSSAAPDATASPRSWLPATQLAEKSRDELHHSYAQNHGARRTSNPGNGTSAFTYSPAFFSASQSDTHATPVPVSQAIERSNADIIYRTARERVDRDQARGF